MEKRMKTITGNDHRDPFLPFPLSASKVRVEGKGQGIGVQGLRFVISASGFRIWGCGSRNEGLGLRGRT